MQRIITKAEAPTLSALCNLLNSLQQQHDHDGELFSDAVALDDLPVYSLGAPNNDLPGQEAYSWDKTHAIYHPHGFDVEHSDDGTWRIEKRTD